MSYTLIDLEQDVESIISELAEVRAQKGHDYSGVEDTLDNLRDYGWRGVEVRLGDKQKRLMHFVKSGGDLQVKDESIEDTMKDRINYALFSLILYRQDKLACEDLRCKEGFALGRYPTRPEGRRTASEEISVMQELPPIRELPKSKIVNWESELPGGEV